MKFLNIQFYHRYHDNRYIFAELYQIPLHCGRPLHGAAEFATHLKQQLKFYRSPYDTWEGKENQYLKQND